MNCPDCGVNVDEFILHNEGCPKFSQEIQEFISRYEAEAASWPDEARKALDDLNAMHSHLFRKWLSATVGERKWRECAEGLAKHTRTGSNEDLGEALAKFDALKGTE